jgi:hypothetical protein
MMRGGPVAIAIAATMVSAGMVRRIAPIEHAELEERYSGPELQRRIRGVAGAGHAPASQRPIPQPCTFVRKPGKRALRRARGRARAA